MMWEVEHTDTFGGEANYCWRHRHHIEDGSRRALVRRAKAACGLTGVRCDVTDLGDMLEIRPRGICQIVFVSPVEYWQACQSELIDAEAKRLDAAIAQQQERK